MRKEDLFEIMFRSFFVIATGVITSMYIFCLIFEPDASFSLNDIGRVLLMAFVSEFPFILFYSRKELGKKQMLIRTLIHFPVLLTLLIFFAQLWDWVDIYNFKEVIVLVLLIMGVYGIVLSATAYQDQKLADKLNESLKRRYHS